ncbi:hypothetical protein [Methanolobus vulcani]|uniref:Uncharacterized protein n=1 Tax=Methanolobus vulcani TaxID=38026 RepID=A0A7Z8KLN8_9EURY|nr:hypothetical protein [Methanolobus vulcani]TQD23565.1 hypothetical protein FKV42_13675 [Methanolobus vulcani]
MFSPMVILTIVKLVLAYGMYLFVSQSYPFVPTLTVSAWALGTAFTVYDGSKIKYSIIVISIVALISFIKWFGQFV